VIEAQSTNSFKNRLDKTGQIYYGRMKASATELINIKYQVSSINGEWPTANRMVT